MAGKGRTPSPIYLSGKVTNLRRDAGILPHRRKRAIAFGWYGGKFSHLNWLLPLLPRMPSLLRALWWFGGRAHQSRPFPGRNV